MAAGTSGGHNKIFLLSVLYWGVRRRGVVKFVRKVGAVLAEQVAHYFGMPVEEARRLLDELVERGELRAVEIAGLKFYFVDPKEAAEVILGSIKPD